MNMITIVPTTARSFYEIDQPGAYHVALTVPAGADMQVNIVIATHEHLSLTITIDLADPDASGTVSLVQMLTGSACTEIRTHQHHRAPRTESTVTLHTVLYGTASTTYHGLQQIDKGAAQSISHQSQRMILVSDQARAHTTPSLEVHTDDVQCSHASALMALDQEQLWYAATRGIETARAESLLISGFLKSALPAGSPHEQNVSTWIAQQYHFDFS